MMAMVREYVLALGMLTAVPAWAAPCYADGDIVTLEGTATQQASRQSDQSGKSAWVLTLARPVCVLSAATAQGARQQSNVAAVQIVDAVPTNNARMQLTGKLVTGNTSTYYAVPTAIWVLKQRTLPGE